MARDRSMARANCFTSRTGDVASLFSSARDLAHVARLEQGLEVVVREAHVSLHLRLLRGEELHDLVELAVLAGHAQGRQAQKRQADPAGERSTAFFANPMALSRVFSSPA